MVEKTGWSIEYIGALPFTTVTEALDTWSALHKRAVSEFNENSGIDRGVPAPMEQMPNMAESQLMSGGTVKANGKRMNGPPIAYDNVPPYVKERMEARKKQRELSKIE